MRKKIIEIIFIVIILANSYIYLNIYFVSHKKILEENLNGSQAVPNSELPEGIFTFVAPNDILIFNNLSLEECYNYNISIELITTHNVSSIKIRIRDPENSLYDIFENKMSYESENERKYEIPFGTALTGNYTLEFYVQTTFNANILINVRKDQKVLYDKLSRQEIDNITSYDVLKFHKNQYIEQNIQLDNDIMYLFYFGRVSSISHLKNIDLQIDINLTDPTEVEFEIYSKESVCNINEMNEFYFGTANEGLYTLKIRLYCQVDYVNIGFAIINSYKISGPIDPNQTNNSKTSNTTYNIPTEFMIGTMVFVGILCGASILIFVYYNKKKRI
ncbi:MAG: hypothetical protein ACFFCE_00315 [Promethearchaeota archaeon]